MYKAQRICITFPEKVLPRFQDNSERLQDCSWGCNMSKHRWDLMRTLLGQPERTGYGGLFFLSSTSKCTASTMLTMWKTMFIFIYGLILSTYYGMAGSWYVNQFQASKSTDIDGSAPDPKSSWIRPQRFIRSVRGSHDMKNPWAATPVLHSLIILNHMCLWLFNNF